LGEAARAAGLTTLSAGSGVLLFNAVTHYREFELKSSFNMQRVIETEIACCQQDRLSAVFINSAPPPGNYYLHFKVGKPRLRKTRFLAQGHTASRD
jgi:hypothetical protein